MDVDDSVATTFTQVSDPTGNLLIPRNERRKAIILSAPVGFTTVVSIGTSQQAGAGIVLAPNDPVLMLSDLDVGRGIRSAINLADSAGAQRTYSWIEFMD